MYVCMYVCYHVCMCASRFGTNIWNSTPLSIRQLSCSYICLEETPRHYLFQQHNYINAHHFHFFFHRVYWFSLSSSLFLLPTIISKFQLPTNICIHLIYLSLIWLSTKILNFHLFKNLYPDPSFSHLRPREHPP